MADAGRNPGIDELRATIEQLERRLAARTVEIEAANKALKAESIERELAEEDRRRMQVRLLGAQKLESLGILAGGVAHDLNNLLVAILGNAGLALRELPPDSPTRSSIAEIESAALRAAELTRQLLGQADRGQAAGEPPPEPERRAGLRRTGAVLVVDDEETVRNVARRILESAGFRVQTARGGIEALRLLREDPDSVDGVLLDQTMPDMSGTVTLTELLRIRPGLPVVLSSGYAHEVTPGAQPLAAGFIHKPYRPEQLVEAMARVLG